MLKSNQTEILKLELLRMKAIINEIVNTSNANLNRNDLLEYINNLNRMLIIVGQISKSLNVAKERGNKALKVITYEEEKSCLKNDPDSIELQEKLDYLYKLAIENKSTKSNKEESLKKSVKSNKVGKKSIN